MQRIIFGLIAWAGIVMAADKPVYFGGKIWKGPGGTPTPTATATVSPTFTPTNTATPSPTGTPYEARQR